MPTSTRKPRSPRAHPVPERRQTGGLTKHEGMAHLQAFLDAISRFVTTGDGEAVAKMWDYPALVVSATDMFSITEPSEMARFFGGAREQYNARGIVDTRTEIQHAAWLTDRIVTTTVRWPYLDAQGNEVGEETSTYTLRKNPDGELRVCFAVMHGEKRT